MADYIEREAAIEATKEHWCDCARALETIMNIPAENVAPVVHGMWKILRDDKISRSVACTACNDVFYYAKRGQLNIDKMPYCPSCGAKMDGDSKEVKK